jgi:DNA-binding CsgD family transcriptional regulator
MTRLRWLLEPVLAIALFVAWLLVSAQPLQLGGIPMRSDMAITNEYAVLLAGSFALALAVSRLSSSASVGIVAFALIAQLLGWASRFTQTGWTAYLMLLVLVAALAVHTTGRLRQIAMIGAAPAALVVAALLNLPALSLSGDHGTLTGKDLDGPDVWEGFAICAVGGTVAIALIWRAATRVSRWFDGRRAAREPQASTLTPDSLTPREREIYLMVARGLTNVEIADAVHIEESTVKTHVGRLFTKLNLSSRSGIIAHAYRVGALVPEPVTDEGRAPGAPFP